MTDEELRDAIEAHDHTAAEVDFLFKAVEKAIDKKKAIRTAIRDEAIARVGTGRTVVLDNFRIRPTMVGLSIWDVTQRMDTA